jgi:hypothetical protein
MECRRPRSAITELIGLVPGVVLATGRPPISDSRQPNALKIYGFTAKFHNRSFAGNHGRALRYKGWLIGLDAKSFQTGTEISWQRPSITVLSQPISRRYKTRLWLGTGFDLSRRREHP